MEYVTDLRPGADQHTPNDDEFIMIGDLNIVVSALYPIKLYKTYSFSDILNWCTENNTYMAAWHSGEVILAPGTNLYPMGTSYYQKYTIFYFIHQNEAVLFKLQFSELLYDSDIPVFGRHKI